ncbi:MAG: hypothetical protein IJ538_01795 [Clostridia bacterium]|nr:hypothetical protein [Clostridia bacterium]
MGNVGSVDIEELKRVREELNRERGIETNPNMYDNYNPNRSADEESQSDDQQNENFDANESAENNVSADETTFSNDDETSTENELNLDQFDLADEKEDLSNEDEADEVSEELDEEVQNDLEETTENLDTDSEIENNDQAESVSENNSSLEKTIDEMKPEEQTDANKTKDFSVYDSFSAFEINDAKSVGQIEDEPQSNEVTVDEEENESDMSDDDLFEQILANYGAGDSAEQSSALEEKEDVPEDESIEPEPQTEDVKPAENEGIFLNDSQILNYDEEPDIEKFNDEPDEVETFEESNESNETDEGDVQPLNEPENNTNEEPLESPIVENAESESIETESVNFEQPSEQTINLDDDEGNEISVNTISEPDQILKVRNERPHIVSDAYVSDEEIEEITKNAHRQVVDKSLPILPNFNFIKLVSSERFKNNGNLTYVIGKNEKDETAFLNMNDVKNVAIFSHDEEVVFRQISSIMLSLMLKNTPDELNFVLLDKNKSSALRVFENSNYLFFNKIANTNREINEGLTEISKEIDYRYKQLGLVGARSIESFNEKVAEPYKLPHIVVIYNNFINDETEEYIEQVNSNLSNILRYGRLVGIYVFVVSKDVIQNNSINYNLPTRIVYRTEDENESLEKLSMKGAEELANDDEFLWLAYDAKKPIHVKTPQISLREIELIIKNNEN